MPKTTEPDEAVENERDLTAYATKPATASLEYYAEWLTEATGYDPGSAKSKQEAFDRAVYLAVSLHRDFQTSPENQEFKERLKAAREAEAEQRATEREEVRKAKEAEKAEAQRAKEAAAAEKAAAKPKPAPPAKAAKATKAAAAPATAAKPTRAPRRAAKGAATPAPF